MDWKIGAVALVLIMGLGWLAIDSARRISALEEQVSTMREQVWTMRGMLGLSR